MTKSGHLWAIGYDNMGRADQVRDEIISLGWGTSITSCSMTWQWSCGTPTDHSRSNREAFPAASNVLGCSVVGLLAGLVVGAPLIGAAIGAMVGGAGSVAALASAGIGDDFVREVKELMKPGTSAIFVLDDEGDMDVILHAIRGLGGTVLKTNVDLERAQLIQSTLAAPSAQTSKSDDK